MNKYLLAQAEICDDGKYRYLLRRIWKGGDGCCLFVMLNPSTADATQDDATLRKCVSFAKREGYEELAVVNLFALRSRHPKSLAPDWAGSVGPANDEHLKLAALTSDLIVAAWGANETMGRAAPVLRLLRQYRDVYCLGTTKDGHPQHPLYLPSDTPLKIYARKETP